MKKVAVVILNWNGESLLEKFIPPLIKYTDNNLADIFVADNASSDSSISLLKNNFPEINIIQHPVNYGFAEGYNKSIAQIEYNYIVLLNSDVEVSENWLPPLIRELDKSKNTACVVPKILDHKNREYFEYAGAAGGFIDKYGYPFCRGRIFESLEKDKGQYNESSEIFWASGACLCIRRKDYIDLQGLDKDFFAHMEEIDLCWRIHKAGKEIRYVADSKVYHVGGGTLDALSPFKTYLNFRNNLYLLTKNLPGKLIFSTIFIRLVLDGIAGVRFLFQGKIRFVFSIIKAHFSFYASIPSLKRKRKNIIPGNIDNYKHLIFQKSIISEYFLKNKKHFSDINMNL
ncbi:MAG: dTDP-Rha--alpha-D-GlcNAc-pyrophosphate polyprenol alpha-3-L-rhamnosyltransferase [Marinilabiliales bacterium]|nr:MAG: dTDP-Rha--alpha-D-GlcNAc-pyrophosphate polyprenol alpha-3-L-rhamnosyltransferase [Marinilabiliales bacterium]